ncbi:MAG: 50S ribosomal protein L3 [Spirochaetes bacterium ADurb.Bin218]|mgnify:CR=1 FL=1|jgi:large subunit ribosomal protein L3|nr:50S ribosomal protein L3 [Spirochaetota bacterium]OQB00364.1 MAG: 50S ribosomal protein L3 [Spirochaetes bacterium ADurb.Bin218]HOQ10734.1 50S ribosomal protein L3 [Spirochaetota bacterium]HPX91013.1 50S ribosomal protein L3 [Spirochaetota bacterium]
MRKALFGKKIGMTQYVKEDGTVVPVTACELGPCVVVQKKTIEKDGYEALKLGFGDQKIQRLTKPIAEDLKKNNIAPKRYFGEIEAFDPSLEVGSEIRCTIFQENDTVDVTGFSKGKGFAGVMKRHGFGGGRKTHGSNFHRAPGSIGAYTFPAEVWKGKRMPGRFGGEKVTVKNLKIVKILEDKNIVLISGAIPGRRNSLIKVTVK